MVGIFKNGNYYCSNFAATLAELIPSPVEANEPHVINDSPPMERVVKLSGGDQSKFGPGARAKAVRNKRSLSLSKEWEGWEED